MQPNYTKIILSCILYTLIALLVAFALFVMLMFFVFTKDLANFMYDMGFDRMASSLYYRVYEKTDDISYCHRALSIKINLEHNEKIIEYYETFSADENYSDFINSFNDRNKALSVGVLEKSAIINEENYLVNHYVKALINEGEVDKAKSIAIASFENYENFTFYDQGVYALNWFVNHENINMFNEIHNSSSERLINEMQHYFNVSLSLFNGTTPQSDTDKAYLLALGNRIIAVGQDINTMYVHMNISSDLLESNQDSMESINNVIKGLI